MTQLPVACSLSAQQLRCNAAMLLPGLHATATRSEWLSNGLRLTFAPTSVNLSAIARTIEQERACCQFLSFELFVGAASAPFVLSVTGPDGTLAFLTQLGIEVLNGREYD